MSAISWETIKAGVQSWVVGGSGLDPDHVFFSDEGVARPAIPPFIEISCPSVFQPSHDWVRREANPLADQISWGRTPGFIAVVASAGADTLTSGSPHELLNGDGPFGILSIGGIVPAPLDPDANYWAVKTAANDIKLADTFAHTGGNYVGNPITTIDLEDAGTGTLHLFLRTSAVRAGKENLRRAQGIREVTFQMQVFGGEKTAEHPELGGTLAMQLATDVLASAPLYNYELDQAGIGMSSLAIADIESGAKQSSGRLGGIFEPRVIVQFTAYVASEVLRTIGRIDKVSITPVATLEDGTEETLDPVVVNP